MTSVKKHIRVAVDIRDLQIAASGTKTFLEELIAEFNKADHSFSFYYIDSPRKVYTGNNILGKLREQLKYFFWKQIELPYKAWRNKCDVVFCSDFMVPYVHLGFKTIPVFHDAFFWEYPEHYNKWWLKLFRGMAVAAAKRSYCIVTPTEYSKKKIVEYTGISSQQIITIGEGPKSMQELSTIDLPPIPYLLHVGTLERRKNLPALIKAFKMIRDKGYNINLALVGKASNKFSLDDSTTIDTLIKDLELEKYIIRTGYLSNEKLASYYANALAYVFPSFNEGFGIPILEAFTYKTPVLIANNSCLPEVAGDAALAFDPYNIEEIVNAILSILKNENLRTQLIEKGTIQLKNYSWSKTAKQLLELFAQTK